MKAEQLDGLRTIVSNKSRLPSLTLRPGVLGAVAFKRDWRSKCRHAFRALISKTVECRGLLPILRYRVQTSFWR